MKRRWMVAVAAFVLLGCAGVGYLAFPRSSAAVADANAVPNDPKIIAYGAYLARMGDCTACHTDTDGGRPFAGGLPLGSPMGTIYATNITPDATFGIGKYTEAQFARAVREGIRRDGTRLYPAMPYPDYAGISDADLHALYVYFMKGVKPVAQASPTTALAFPFNQRWGMTFWDMAFARQKASDEHRTDDIDVQRGRYLVETLGHCGSCHSPRGFGMQEVALNDASAAFLSGGNLNGWPVPSLRGMPSWTVKDIVDYLGTGRNSFASVGGEMTGVVEHSMQHVTASDLNAIAVYLKSLPSTGVEGNGRPNPELATAQTTQALIDGQHLSRGQLLYLDNCEACHWTDGGGAKGIFPRLNGADVVVATNPGGLIHVMLSGAQTPSTPGAPSVMAMPGFADRLNDRDVAALATFIRGGWSNHAPPVTPDLVKKIRTTLTDAAQKQIKKPAVISSKQVSP